MLPAPTADALRRALVVVGPELGTEVAELVQAAVGAETVVSAGADADAGRPLVYVGRHRPGRPALADWLWVHASSAGVEGMLGDGDWPAATALTRTVGAMGRRMAEYVLAHLLAEHQHVTAYAEDQRAQRWEERRPGLARGEVALVLGTGAIGREIAALLVAAGLEVHGLASSPRELAPFATVVDRAGALALERPVRWLVAALPLTPGTRGLIDAELLQAFPGARLINVGRGATVVEGDLLAALADGTLAGAVLDVLPEEPPPPGSPWWTAPRTRLTPHASGPTLPEDVAGELAACWTAFAAGERPPLQVDPTRGY